MEVLIAVAAGFVSGGLIWRARVWPGLGWVALVPVGVAMVLSGPLAGIAGGLATAIGSAAVVATPVMRSLVAISAVPTAIAGGVWAAAGGWLVGEHQGVWVVPALALLPVMATLPIRLLGAPRWVTSPLACSQEPWLVVMHTARVAGDVGTSVVLGLGSAAVVLALPTPVQSWAGAVACAVAVSIALALAGLALRRARLRAEAAPRVKVGIVVADGPPPANGLAGGLWPIESPDYRDVAATARRYEPHVREAAARGARVIVLPEVAVAVDDQNRASWIETAARWAREHGFTVVAPFFDHSVPVNTLRVVEPDGAVHTYDKQHPGRGLEPPAGPHRSIGPHPSVTRPFPISTVICVDLDYPDLVSPMRRAGGLLCVPANDWLDGFEELHHRTAVWAAVCTGTTVVRATGHGISAVFDGAGRVLEQASSERGPVVLVVDAPVCRPR